MAERTIVKGRGMPGKDDANYRLYSDGTILLFGVRMSYPHFGKPYQGKPNEDGSLPPKKFSGKFMLPKDTHDAAKRLIEQQIDKILDGDTLKADFKFLKDGDLEGKPEMKGHWIVNASENEDRRPALRGINGEKIDADHMGERKIDEMFQGGYWCDLLISPWRQKAHGKKVNASLRAVKLDRLDTTFGEGGISDDDVDDAFGIKGDTGGFDDEPASDDL